MNNDRFGDWIQTASGRQFWPLDPRAEDVDINDIAHALSQLCRFTGHTRHFYSVAQHSVLCSQILEAPETQLLALMHDAGEAYLGDIARPWKRFLRVHLHSRDVVELSGAEERLLTVILRSLGVFESAAAWQVVKRIDEILLVTEARDLMSPLHPEWHHSEENGFQSLSTRIIPWSPEEARTRFLHRFAELKRACE